MLIIFFIYLKIIFDYLDKQFRENSNFICLFKQDNKNIQYIYQDHVFLWICLMMNLKDCNICWGKPYNFLVIDNSCDLNNEKYRCTLDNFYFLENAHTIFETTCINTSNKEQLQLTLVLTPVVFVLFNPAIQVSNDENYEVKFS